MAAGLAAAALRDGRWDVIDEASLEAIVAEANRRVWERSVADPSTAGMGTTVTVALADPADEQIVFGHVGDSRAYRLRGDVLEQITTDHSPLRWASENSTNLPLWNAVVLNGLTGVLIRDIRASFRGVGEWCVAAKIGAVVQCIKSNDGMESIESPYGIRVIGARRNSSDLP